MENLSAVLKGKKDLQLERRPVPEPAKNEVRIRINYCCLGGADLKRYNDGEIGGVQLNKPVALGHEAVGTVHKQGSGVVDTKLKIGDRVALERPRPCNACEFCKNGRYNLCQAVTLDTVATQPGLMCQYVCHPADLCHVLPDSVSTQDGALTELAAIAVHACQRVSLGVGNSLLVCGAGPVGLAVAHVAKAMGSSKVIVTDLVDSRLQKAKEMGADFVVRSSEDKDTLVLVEDIKKMLGGLPDRTIDCVGNKKSVQLAIMANKHGGAIGLLGLQEQEVRVPLTKAARKQVDVRGIWRYCNSFPTAIKLMADGKVSLGGLITGEHSLSDLSAAIESITKPGMDPAKVLIKCSEG